MSKMIGVIAEDNSDIDVIEEILKKYINECEFKIKKFIGNGCGKLRNKCDSWTNTLFGSGCDYVFIFHDLDRNNANELRSKLELKVCPKKNPKSLIVIPKEELEAWLLTDSLAIKNVFNLKKQPKAITDCESINSPKEFLKDLIYRSDKKRYLNTVHNRKIAREIRLENLKYCASFRPFDNFIVKNFSA